MKSKLQKQYEAACMAYIKQFEAKQGVKFIGWGKGLIGHMAAFEGSQLHFFDVVYDINSNQPKGKIFEWDTNPKNYFTSYFDYCKEK